MKPVVTRISDGFCIQVTLRCRGSFCEAGRCTYWLPEMACVLCGWLKCSDWPWGRYSRSVLTHEVLAAVVVCSLHNVACNLHNALGC